MDVSSLEVVAALAISPAITSPPATDTSSSSGSGCDCDHRDQGRDATTSPVVTNGGRGRSFSPASQLESVSIGTNEWNLYTVRIDS